jgi:hypothetical protein
MGYSYGKPLIAKTYADGWVAIFTSATTRRARRSCMSSTSRPAR